MMPIVVFAVFFAALVIGSLVANARGTLPTADELEARDRARTEHYRQSL